jgi:spore maturation protein CgeB
MKIVFFCTYYPQYLDSFYKKNPGLKTLSYDEQLMKIRMDYFGVYTSYVHYLQKMGIEASLIIPNCKPLQQAWARENALQFNEKDWQYSVPLAQVKAARPDIFYISSMFEYYGMFLDEVRKYVRNIFGWISCDIPKGIDIRQIDVLFSSVPQFVEKFKNYGVPSEILHAAFDPQILKLCGNIHKKEIDFSFIGNLTMNHSKRIHMINELMKKTELKFFGTGVNLLSYRSSILTKFLLRNVYKKRVSGQVWGIEMYKTLQNSKITFNSHIDISGQFAGNMRMYEATGMGSMLLTDGKYSQQKNFDDNEVVYYENVNDAIEKLEYYLRNDDERNKIAINGQKRTLENYNYQRSTSQLLEYFHKYTK